MEQCLKGGTHCTELCWGGAERAAAHRKPMGICLERMALWKRSTCSRGPWKNVKNRTLWVDCSSGIRGRRVESKAWPGKKRDGGEGGFVFVSHYF